MSGDADHETMFDSIHPGEPEVRQELPRHSKRLWQSKTDDRFHSVLSDAVRKLALPRLLASRLADSELTACEISSLSEEDCQRFLQLITSPDYHLAESFVSILVLRGVTRADLLLQLFTPAARQLHDLWIRDDLTFADVTLAVGRMQRLMRSAVMPDAPLHFGQRGGSILIAPPPGDSHAFGSVIFEDFFRSAEWTTERLTPRTEEELVDRLRIQAFDVLAISISQECSLDRLALLLRHLRRESANPRLLVLVGGFPLRDDPEAWKRVGGDGTAPDAAVAVKIANKLLMSILPDGDEERYGLRTV